MNHSSSWISYCSESSDYAVGQRVWGQYCSSSRLCMLVTLPSPSVATLVHWARTMTTIVFAACWPIPVSAATFLVSFCPLCGLLYFDIFFSSQVGRDFKNIVGQVPLVTTPCPSPKPPKPQNSVCFPRVCCYTAWDKVINPLLWVKHDDVDAEVTHFTPRYTQHLKGPLQTPNSKPVTLWIMAWFLGVNCGETLITRHPASSIDHLRQRMRVFHPAA